MNREIVLDTETTGLDPGTGDRIVEIACLELINRFPSGRAWHYYFNPERNMPADAFKIHGIAGEFLLDKPKFAALAGGFIEFVGDATLIIHNAPFDIKFLNFELTQAGHAALAMDRVVDTLQLARRKHPGSPASLDALCKRYGIDTAIRTKHGALVDCKLLADVYVELLGERQAHLSLAANSAAATANATGQRGRRNMAMARPEPLSPRLTEQEQADHRAFIKTLGPQSLWAQQEKS